MNVTIKNWKELEERQKNELNDFHTLADQKHHEMAMTHHIIESALDGWVPDIIKEKFERDSKTWEKDFGKNSELSKSINARHKKEIFDLIEYQRQRGETPESELLTQAQIWEVTDPSNSNVLTGAEFLRLLEENSPTKNFSDDRER